ncbi:type IV pilus secretin PilQ [Cellvibrio japonicus]|nr:type IV pilus secretin PilQ family protein [Cellvibrio japonicus]
MDALFSSGLNMRKIAILIVCFASALANANSINKIDFSQLPGERFEVHIGFDSVPPEPKGYTIERPARIVLDFPDTSSSLKERRFPLAVDNGQSALLLASEGRTRLILNLNQLSTYTTRTDGNSFIVEVGAAQVGGAKSNAQHGSGLISNASGGLSAQDSIKGVRVTNIDFRRGATGEGRVIVSLSNPKVSANMVGTGTGVRLSFKDVWLPPELRRRLDVVDFATPVSLVAAAQDGENSVLNISASGDFDYLAYQTDNEYVVSIKPLTEREKQEKKKDFEYTGQKLSLDFQDIEVRAVLQIIADFTDLNLVASDTVQGRITLRLQNVPWDQALEMVLKNKGLDKRQVGNVLMVAPAAEIAERERQEIATKKQLEELAPLRTEYIRVRYANAKEMFELFRGGQGAGSGRGGASAGGQGGNQSTGSVLSERGQGIVDERTNSIIITDTADRIEAFRRLVEQIDIPIRQVMIESRIVIANTDFERQLGIRWGGAGYHLNNSRLINVAGSQSGLDDEDGTSPANWFTNGGTLNLTENNMVNLPVNNPAGSIAVGVLTDSVFLDMELSALETSGYAEIVSQPKVITSDKQKAVIKSGKEIAYQETSPSGGTTTGFKEAVLMLEVVPQITPDNRIIMDLFVTKDSVGEITQQGVPSLDVTRLQTKVLVNNGQTVVLGGVFSLESTKGESKVPVLGDIPYLGRLFKRTVDNQFKTELLIFVTPKLIADSLTN